MQNIRVVVSFLLMICILLSACRDEGARKADDQPIGKIKIAYADESVFYRDFGHAFRFFRPNIQVDLVFRPDFYARNPEQLDAYFEEYAPDILILDRLEYARLSRLGYLTNLSDYVMDNRWDMEVYIEPAIEMLMLDGEGSLYGLTPYFRSNALFYNKDLFDLYDIPYPQNGMTWDHVMELAQQFVSRGSLEQGHHGMEHAFTREDLNPFTLLNVMNESEGLSYMDADGRVNLMHTRVHELYKMIMQGLQSGAIGVAEDDQRFDLFINGQAAMRYDTYFMLTKYGRMGFELGVVSEPTRGGVSTSYTSDTIFAIPLTSYQKDLAWDMIEFVMGEDFNRLKSRVVNHYGLPVHKSYIDSYVSSNLDKSAFYAHSPIELEAHRELWPYKVSGVLQVARDYSKLALEGEMSIDDALRAIEEELQRRRDES